MKKNLLSLAALALVLGQSAWAQNWPEQLRITYVPAPFNMQCMLIKEQGLLEKALKEHKVQVKWIPIKAGVNQVQGMAAKEIDMVSAMNSSTLLIANAAGNPIQAVTGVARPDDIFALVGHKDRVHGIKDLAGKTVVGPKGTVLHHMFNVVLQQHALEDKKVELISMNLPSSLTMLMTGRTDAALLVGPLVQKAAAAGHPVLTTAAGVIPTNLFLSVRKDFAQQYPELVKKVAQVNEQALVWMHEHPKEALAIGAKVHNISQEQAQDLWDRSHFVSGIEQRDIDALTAAQDFLLDQKMMKRRVNVQEIIWKP